MRTFTVIELDKGLFEISNNAIVGQIEITFITKYNTVNEMIEVYAKYYNKSVLVISDNEVFCYENMFGMHKYGIEKFCKNQENFIEVLTLKK